MNEEELKRLLGEEFQKRIPTMSDDQKMVVIRESRDITNTKQLFAEARTAELADEFTRLEVQIAAILFAFIGIFIGSLGERMASLPPYGIFLIKIVLAITILCLIASLLLGLIHIKRKEIFWGDIMRTRVARFAEWMRAARKEITYEQAKAYQEGTGGGKEIIQVSPKWTWIMQTVTLGCAVTLMSLLSMVFLFIK